MKNESRDQSENINLFLEIDLDKKVIYISDCTSNRCDNGTAKKFRDKMDISKIFTDYLFYQVNFSSCKRKNKKYE